MFYTHTYVICININAIVWHFAIRTFARTPLWVCSVVRWLWWWWWWWGCCCGCDGFARQRIYFHCYDYYRKSSKKRYDAWNPICDENILYLERERERAQPNQKHADTHTNGWSDRIGIELCLEVQDCRACFVYVFLCRAEEATPGAQHMSIYLQIIHVASHTLTHTTNIHLATFYADFVVVVVIVFVHTVEIVSNRHNFCTNGAKITLDNFAEWWHWLGAFANSSPIPQNWLARTRIPIFDIDIVTRYNPTSDYISKWMCNDKIPFIFNGIWENSLDTRINGNSHNMHSDWHPHLYHTHFHPKIHKLIIACTRRAFKLDYV